MSLTRVYNDQIRPMLDAIDKLRSLGVKDEGVKLPTIVVVGDQSSGKSSVLESLSGVNLPRGRGICTRVPLILRLKSIIQEDFEQEHEDDDEDCMVMEADEEEEEAAAMEGEDAVGGGEDGRGKLVRENPFATVASASAGEVGRRRFPAKNLTNSVFKVGGGDKKMERTSSSSSLCRPKSRVIIEYGSVRKELDEQSVDAGVREATIALAGNGRDIKDTPITLTVSRRDAPDLTLVDLPGITRVPVDDQPHDIYEQITKIIRNYIEPEESVILNVVSAAVDFSTCEAIRMSQQVDKTGERTLAVVTKIDRAVEGLYDKIVENPVRVGLGYVLVRNRTESDRSYEEARRKEQMFFEKHVSLAPLRERGMLGVPVLAEKLMGIQAERVSRSLPKIRQQLAAILAERQGELSRLPRGISTEAEAGSLLFTLVSAKKEILQRLIIHGDYREENKGLHFAARMHGMLTRFDEDLAAATSDFASADYRKRVVDVMESARGVCLPNFMPNPVFQRLVREEVAKCTKVCETIIPVVCKYAETVALFANEAAMGDYPFLCDRARAVTMEVLEDVEHNCVAFVRRMLVKSADIIYVNDKQYVDVLAKAGSIIPSASGRAEVHPVRDMQINLWAYWQILHRRLADEIPIEIKYAVQEALLSEVDRRLLHLAGSNREQLLELMQEAPATYRRKQNLSRSIRMLKQGLEWVYALPQLSSSITNKLVASSASPIFSPTTTTTSACKNDFDRFPPFLGVSDGAAGAAAASVALLNSAADSLTGAGAGAGGSENGGSAIPGAGLIGTGGRLVMGLIPRGFHKARWPSGNSMDL